MASKTRTHIKKRPVYMGNTFYVKPTYIVSIPKFEVLGAMRSSRQRANEFNLKQNKPSENLSYKARMRILNSVNWLIASAKFKKVYDKKSKQHFWFKVNFLTLTLPDLGYDMKTDDFKKLLLQPWLSYARQYLGLKNYVWKLEPHKSGKIHCHLTTDTFIHWIALRKSWNKLLISKGFMQKFKEKFGHENPNSTDIHAVKKIGDYGAYIAKYLTKKIAETGLFAGRLWGCNENLSKLNSASIHLDPDEMQQQTKSLYDWRITCKPILSKPDCFGIEHKFGDKFLLKQTDWGAIIKGKLYDFFDECRKGIQNPVTLFSIN